MSINRGLGSIESTGVAEYQGLKPNAIAGVPWSQWWKGCRAHWGFRNERLEMLEGLQVAIITLAQNYEDLTRPEHFP